MKPAAAAKSTVLGLGWLVVALLVALGAAGIVAATSHQPGGAARPELTYTGDAAVLPAIDAATAELDLLASDVAAFAATARDALTHVTGLDPDGLEAAMTEGSAQLGAVRDRAAAFRGAVEDIRGMGPGSEIRTGVVVRSRYAGLVEATLVTGDLDAAWAAFDRRALDAARVASLLNRHDERAGAAVVAGSEGRYADALPQLDEAEAVIAELRALTEELGGSIDVALLTDWVDRNAAYDQALRRLYEAVIAAEGRATAEVRDALATERAARQILPADNRALIVIMSDIAQGGITQAVVRIEQARGRLEGALELQRELQSGTTLPG